MSEKIIPMPQGRPIDGPRVLINQRLVSEAINRHSPVVSIINFDGAEYSLDDLNQRIQILCAVFDMISKKIKES